MDNHILAAYEAGTTWARNLKPGDTFTGYHTEAKARYAYTLAMQLFIAGAMHHTGRLWDESGIEIIGVGLIDTLATLSKVEKGA